MDLATTITGAQLRSAMAKLPTGVVVVTSEEDGNPVGMTVSAFTSVSDTPPTVLVCLNNKSHTTGVVRRTGRYGVNLLGGSQRVVAQRFATPGLNHAKRFDGLPTVRARTGSPLLTDALCWLDCTVIKTEEIGTHLVAYGSVVAVESFLTEEVPLVYYNRGLAPFA
ncbi:flavin reductase family protein [Streptomyces sp. NPDC002513]